MSTADRAWDRLSSIPTEEPKEIAMRWTWCVTSLACLSVACGPAEPPASPMVAITPIAASAAPSADPVETASCPAGMAFIPGATFKMGSPDDDPDADSDEHPEHTVKLASFCLAKTETTVAAYEQCVKAGRCAAAPTTSDWNGSDDDVNGSEHCNAGEKDRQDHPINCVDWTQANTYCKAQGLRLPTEEEWELAARGTTGRRFPWGSDEPSPELLNGCGPECDGLLTSWGTSTRTYDRADPWPTTSPAGAFPQGATPEGVLDLGGNLLEWTGTLYCDYPSHDCDIEERATRGGGWPSSAQNQRAAGRGRGHPNKRHEALGFRCAKGI